jgi:hypothetical protein
MASSQRSAGEDPKESLKRAFAVIKALLKAKNVPATIELISQSVPVWVLEGTIELGWISNPPPSWLPDNYASVYGTPKQRGSEPPESELQVRVGAYDVPESYRTWFLATLKPAIEGWQGEMLRDSVPTKIAVPAVHTDAGIDSIFDFTSDEGRKRAVFDYTSKSQCSEAALARTARVHPADLSKWKIGRLPAQSDKKTRIEKALINDHSPALPVPPKSVL